MGHIQRKRPRRGSLQFWPRKRASRPYARVRNWHLSKDVRLNGFPAYKAGMTHIISVESNKNSSRKGEEVKVPVTVLEAPEIRILGIRAYKKEAYGIVPSFELWSDSLELDLARKLSIPKKKTEQQKIKELEEKLSQFVELRALIYTQPRKAGLKKTPEVMEVAIGGSDMSEKLKYAKEILGKELDISSVFKEGQIVDTHSVSLGKGIQGSIKRFGVKLRVRKSEKGRRRVSTLGNWDAKTWRVPHPGQTGYHLRTEYNKKIIKISSEAEAKITPAGGFLHYGPISGRYILLAGSIPGTEKRLITLTTPARQRRLLTEALNEIVSVSTRSQQGN